MQHTVAASLRFWLYKVLVFWNKYPLLFCRTRLDDNSSAYLLCYWFIRLSCILSCIFSPCLWCFGLSVSACKTFWSLQLFSAPSPAPLELSGDRDKNWVQHSRCGYSSVLQSSRKRWTVFFPTPAQMMHSIVGCCCTWSVKILTTNGILQNMQ